jgi:hypothetical protein
MLRQPPLRRGTTETGSVTISKIGVESASASPLTAARGRETAGTWGGAGGMSLSGAPAGTTVAAIVSPQISEPLLNGFIPTDDVALRRLHREIYYNDSVSGAAIDLLSTLPFGDFSVIGMEKETQLAKFADCIDRVQIKSLLPVLSVDYLAVGAFVGSTNWSSRAKLYDAILPHNLDFCEISRIPIYGVDPLVTLKFPPDMIKALTDAKNEGLRAFIPESLRNRLSGNGAQAGIPLPPEEVIFIDRPGMLSDYKGVSLLQRVLPLWLVEKALIRGTLDSVWKRQRPLMHISAGDETWDPTDADLSLLNQLFLNSDLDPNGAMITTRNGINVQEYRRGDDFYKWSDVYDWLRGAKLMALGVSESLLTGEGNFQTVEGSLSVTMQYFDAYRSRITNEIFYEKLFPKIAQENGWLRKKDLMVAGVAGESDVKLNSQGELEVAFSGGKSSTVLNNGLMTPKVQWHTDLKSDRSTTYLDTLERLEMKGVPIPLRVWAAAGGLNIGQLAEQQSSDNKIRDSFGPWVKDIRKYQGVEDPAQAGGGEGQGGGMFSSVSAQGIMNREYDPDDMGVFGVNGKGKRVPVSARRAKELSQAANKEIARAAIKLENEREFRENKAHNDAK